MLKRHLAKAQALVSSQVPETTIGHESDLVTADAAHSSLMSSTLPIQSYERPDAPDYSDSESAVAMSSSVKQSAKRSVRKREGKETALKKAQADASQRTKRPRSSNKSSSQASSPKLDSQSDQLGQFFDEMLGQQHESMFDVSTDASVSIGGMKQRNSIDRYENQDHLMSSPTLEPSLPRASQNGLNTQETSMQELEFSFSPPFGGQSAANAESSIPPLENSFSFFTSSSRHTLNQNHPQATTGVQPTNQIAQGSIDQLGHQQLQGQQTFESTDDLFQPLDVGLPFNGQSSTNSLSIQVNDLQSQSNSQFPGLGTINNNSRYNLQSHFSLSHNNNFQSVDQANSARGQNGIGSLPSAGGSVAVTTLPMAGPPGAMGPQPNLWRPQAQNLTNRQFEGRPDDARFSASNNLTGSDTDRLSQLMHSIMQSTPQEQEEMLAMLMSKAGSKDAQK